MNTVLYISVTNDLSKRIAEHKRASVEGFTKQYKVHKLVYYEIFKSVLQAIKREKQLKHWVRSKKEALINSVNPTWDELTPQ